MKKIIVGLLLTFVAVSIGFIFLNGNDEASAKTPRFSNDPVTVVYYFHGNTRCRTCRNMEAYTKETVETRFAPQVTKNAVVYQVVNVEDAGNERFVKDYQLTSRSVVVSYQIGGKELNWRRLDRVWDLVAEKPAFMDYVQDEVKAVLPPEA